MNLELFIARRLASKASRKSSASDTILKIATLAIALGMVMMIIAIGVTLGLQREIRQKVAAFNGDIFISNFDGNSSLESITPIPLEQEFYPEFISVPEVVHVQGVAAKGGIIRTESDFEGVVVKGLGADYDWSRISDFLVEGRFPVLNDSLNRETLMSTYLANRLGFSIGDKVVVYFIKKENGKVNTLRLDIVGLYKSAYQEYDKAYIMADIRHIQRLNRWKNGEVGGFEAFVDDFSNVQEINNRVYENTGSFLRSMTVKERNYSIFEWISLFDFNMALIITIMIIVGGINIIVALLVLILERTRMIGILKALGASDWTVRKVFLYNASYLIGRGLFWGNVLGLGILGVQKYFKVVTLNPETYYVAAAPVHIHWVAIIALNVGVFAVCMLLLLLPSYLITRISPARTIRFE